MSSNSGRAWKFGNSVSTDLITPGRYFHLRSKLEELAKHVLEDADPHFAAGVKRGDFVVAGRNFGCGSSREHAAVTIKLAGARAVLAASFARIFFRNAVNVGLPPIVCDTECIDAGDELALDLAAGTVRNVTKDLVLRFRPLPPLMRRILEDGGLVEHIRKRGDLVIE